MESSLTGIQSPANGAPFSVLAEEDPQNGAGFPPVCGRRVWGSPHCPARRPAAIIPNVAYLILIVDDSPRFRAAAMELLASRGFELFDVAADGPQALAAVARRCRTGSAGRRPAWTGRLRGGGLASRRLPGGENRADFHRRRLCSVQVMATSPAIAFVPKQELVGTDLRSLFAA